MTTTGNQNFEETNMLSQSDLVLVYSERVLIRKALIKMAYAADVNDQDAETLKHLEHQFSDAAEVILKAAI